MRTFYFYWGILSLKLSSSHPCNYLFFKSFYYLCHCNGGFLQRTTTTSSLYPNLSCKFPPQKKKPSKPKKRYPSPITTLPAPYKPTLSPTLKHTPRPPPNFPIQKFSYICPAPSGVIGNRAGCSNIVSTLQGEETLSSGTTLNDKTLALFNLLK